MFIKEWKNVGEKIFKNAKNGKNKQTFRNGIKVVPRVQSK